MIQEADFDLAELCAGPMTFMGVPFRTNAAGAGAAPIGFGGDGSVSLPLVRAAARIHPELAVRHFDSHTDTYAVDPDHRYDAATQFTHAAEEQRVRPSASFHVGLRGTTTQPGVCTPAGCGFSAREGIDLLRGMTAFLAATVTYEILLHVEGRG